MRPVSLDAMDVYRSFFFFQFAPDLKSPRLVQRDVCARITFFPCDSVSGNFSYKYSMFTVQIERGVGLVCAVVLVPALCVSVIVFFLLPPSSLHFIPFIL